MQQFRKRAAGFPPRSFIAASILEMGLPHSSFDVVVTLETFSHVADQPKLIEYAQTVALHLQPKVVLARWATTRNCGCWGCANACVPVPWNAAIISSC